MAEQETLYNGIILPEQWPPRYSEERLASGEPVPYLSNPPDVIHVDLGRQLFVDDFLIRETDCIRIFGKPVVHPASPVLKPETAEEMDNGNCPMAAPFNDGVWYDPADKLFKMWYMPGWFHTTAYAVSTDGIRWERPDLDVVPGTNLVWPPREYHERDGCLVWLDHDARDEAQRYKMFQYYRYGKHNELDEFVDGWLQTSPDGIHWSNPAVTTPVGDNTSFFYNPFRKKWCMSIRRAIRKRDDGSRLPIGLRARFYRESDDFLAGAQWEPETDEALWQICDGSDLPDQRFPDHRVTLYDLNVTPYESIMLGMFGIFRGPENNLCADLGIPKTIDLELGYSRDGFHFSRPDRTPFLASSRKEGDWNRAYLHASGGLCLVMKDELYFYFTGFSGISPKLGPHDEGGPGRMRRVMYAGASTGLATLRRDGFAAMASPTSGARTLLTRPLTFTGKYLFVNADCSCGELRAEILDREGKIIPGFSREQCIAFTGDSTCMGISWVGRDSVQELAGKPVCIRFYLSEAKLYSFWISAKPGGESGGYVAAGGPDFSGSRDE
ncbi:hypothetical protein [Breznakiella homolactica]|uniref:Glycosyl hydrolase family 32 n=1 Tax=Breznakiella homolactica TaxID=2798577 RepID=A0A7T7XPE5_9SPIR|nr:hypothetical protein [Breznakiella homolactica]QQO09943.1 hypothetical protein JFL75_03250 [Breznakiella homolactica]